MLKLVLTGVVCAGVSFAAAAQMNPKEKMAAALKTIQDNYVDTIPEEKLADAAVLGMLRQLDPHSRYFSREEALQMREGMSGSYFGIGIHYMMQQDSVYITQVNPDGPAAMKGLQAGDRIIAIDGISLGGKQLGNIDILKKIRGAKGTTVSLLLWRKSLTAPFTAEITRGSIPDRSVKAAYMVTDKVGYLALRIFNQTTRDEVDQALGKLKSKGMQSLILDLQGNGGGYVDAAIGVADEFLEKNQLVFYSVGHDRGKNYFYTGGYGRFSAGKLVVLIDQNTASASEILSGALQDWDRAILIGRRSFGKGLMQKPWPLPDGSVLELTGARYYTPAGRSIQKPYHGASYDDNVSTRLASGELVNGEVYHHPDSLKYLTLVSKRSVYGGGGIMPDLFVPIDTVEYNGWLDEVAGRGWINKAVFDYMDSNRTSLQQQWPAFTGFLRHFTVPEYLVNRVLASAAGANLPFNPASESRIRSLLRTEMKAQVASQLYTGNEHYAIQVRNMENESYQKAIEVLASPITYEKYLPAPLTPVKNNQKRKK